MIRRVGVIITCCCCCDIPPLLLPLDDDDEDDDDEEEGGAWPSVCVVVDRDPRVTRDAPDNFIADEPGWGGWRELMGCVDGVGE